MPFSLHNSIPQVFAPSQPANMKKPNVFQAILDRLKSAPFKRRKF